MGEICGLLFGRDTGMRPKQTMQAIQNLTVHVTRRILLSKLEAVGILRKRTEKSKNQVKQSYFIYNHYGHNPKEQFHHIKYKRSCIEYVDNYY